MTSLLICYLTLSLMFIEDFLCPCPVLGGLCGYAYTEAKSYNCHFAYSHRTLEEERDIVTGTQFNMSLYSEKSVIIGSKPEEISVDLK